MIYSYTDIQRKYDSELQGAADKSVFLLPRGEHYFNGYVPPKLRPYLHHDDVLQHLINYVHIFENDSSAISTAIRLMLQHSTYLSVDASKFALLCEQALKDENTEFRPNTIAKTIRNPYYRFRTHDKDERNEIRRKHRRELNTKYNVDNNEDRINDALSDYDLNDGLLTKEKLMKLTNVSRYILTQIFEVHPHISDMFTLIRNASITNKYYKKRKCYGK